MLVTAITKLSNKIGNGSYFSPSAISLELKRGDYFVKGLDAKIVRDILEPLVERGEIEREIYENVFKKIEKYYDYLYYNGRVFKKDMMDKNQNILSYEIYEYSEDMELISINEYNSKKEMTEKTIIDLNYSDINTKKYTKFYYEAGKIDRIYEIYKTYDDKEEKLLKEEYFYEKRPIKIIEYFYDGNKIIKEIEIDSITGEVLFVKGYYYKENEKKEYKNLSENKEKNKKEYKSKFKNIYYRGTTNNWGKEKYLINYRKAISHKSHIH